MAGLAEAPAPGGQARGPLRAPANRIPFPPRRGRARRRSSDRDVLLDRGGDGGENTPGALVHGTDVAGSAGGGPCYARCRGFCTRYCRLCPCYPRAGDVNLFHSRQPCHTCLLHHARLPVEVSVRGASVLPARRAAGHAVAAGHCLRCRRACPGTSRWSMASYLTRARFEGAAASLTCCWARSRAPSRGWCLECGTSQPAADGVHVLSSVLAVLGMIFKDVMADALGGADEGREERSQGRHSVHVLDVAFFGQHHWIFARWVVHGSVLLSAIYLFLK